MFINLFPFLSYLLGAQVVWGRYDLPRKVMISKIILLFRKDDFQVPSHKFSGGELFIFANKFLWWDPEKITLRNKPTHQKLLNSSISVTKYYQPKQNAPIFLGEKIPQNLPRHFGCFVLNFPVKKRVPLNDFPRIHFQHERKKTKKLLTFKLNPGCLIGTLIILRIVFEII